MIKTCKFCHSSFKTNKKLAQFCSRECVKKFKYPVIVGKCKFCSKEFIVKSFKGGRKLFCSLQCFHKWNTKDKVKLICENCGKEFYVAPYLAKERRNCSKKCKYELLGKENSIKFKGIPVKKLADRRQLDVYRQIAFNNFPNECFICSQKEVKKLYVHHKDGDRNNNSINNLVILCVSCHKHTHNISSKYKVTLQQSLEIFKNTIDLQQI